MSDYPMLISNKLHSFRNFIFTKVRYAIRFKITLTNDLVPFGITTKTIP